MESTEFDRLERRIGHAFENKRLLEEALTHSSVAERRRDAITYERLEFVGDRILGLVVAEYLHANHPSEGEAKMALRFNALVNYEACARAARRVDLGAALLLSESELRTGGREKETILADACEALIAALYFDGGLDTARRFILDAWGAELSAPGEAPRDPKTALQEWAAQRRRPNPVYEVVERLGPDHAPSFVVEAKVDGLPSTRGAGGSKRDAERQAARALLSEVGVHV
jgi:ribonuclease-3